MTIRIRRDRDGAVATISIDNTARLNCLGHAQITAFIEAVTTLADDSGPACADRHRRG